MTKGRLDSFDGVGNGFEEFVHEFRLFHFRDIYDGLHPAALAPSRLRVGTAAAGQHQDAGVRPFKGFEVIGELPFRCRMDQTFLILGERPFRAVRVDFSLAESVSAARRVPEIIHFVSVFPEFLHNLGIVLIAPARRYIDSCHDRFGLKQ